MCWRDYDTRPGYCKRQLSINRAMCSRRFFPDSSATRTISTARVFPSFPIGSFHVFLPLSDPLAVTIPGPSRSFHSLLPSRPYPA